MRSNYEADRSPHPGERQAIALYMSVSMFESPEPIERVARARPERVGSHVARVELRPGLGLCRADTSGPEHWSVWGLPRQLVLMAFADNGLVAIATPGERLVIPA